jgi:hypothetical protein
MKRPDLVRYACPTCGCTEDVPADEARRARRRCGAVFPMRGNAKCLGMAERQGPAPSRARKPLRARSAKTRKRYAGEEGRAAFVARILSERTKCEAGVLIGTHLLNLEGKHPKTAAAARAAVQCSVRAREVHEVLARSAGGSILDAGNVRALCHRCHAWIGDHPKAALALGLRRSRYAGRNVGEEVRDA